jgi:hypothetical protein
LIQRWGISNSWEDDPNIEGIETDRRWFPHGFSPPVRRKDLYTHWEDEVDEVDLGDLATLQLDIRKCP